MSRKLQINETFDTREGAEVYLQQYLRSYATQGYGTMLAVSPSKIPNKWVVYGHRYNTSD